MNKSDYINLFKFQYSLAHYNTQPGTRAGLQPDRNRISIGSCRLKQRGEARGNKSYNAIFFKSTRNSETM